MLNRVVLMGRITQDLVLKQTQGGTSVLSFTVAVDRGFTDQNGERQTDFINCVAWRQTAEFITRYFSKGRMIAVEGNLRTRTYDDKNGTRHYVTEVYVDNTSFTGEPRQEGSRERSYSNNGYSNNNAPSYENTPAPTNDLSIGSLKDFEEVIGDEDAPF